MAHQDILKRLQPLTSHPTGPLPVNFGVVVFPGFQALDIFGPLDALNTLSIRFQLNLAVIAATLDPVSTKPPPAFNPLGSNFSETIVPTHDFATAPPLDVLIVPGGIGAMTDEIKPVADFIAKVYPSLKYLITVCDGSGIAARSGVLDGKRATSAKVMWDQIVALGPKVNWVSHARWVVDGNIWTSSGVSAGLDAIFAFIEKVYGVEVADNVSNILEYERHKDSNWDPFAVIYNLPA